MLAMVIVPALLMVSTIRFRSFKTFDLQSRRSYPVLCWIALGLALLAAQPGARAPGDRLHLPGLGLHRDGLDAAAPRGRDGDRRAAGDNRASQRAERRSDAASR